MKKNICPFSSLARWIVGTVHPVPLCLGAPSCGRLCTNTFFHRRKPSPFSPLVASPRSLAHVSFQTLLPPLILALSVDSLSFSRRRRTAPVYHRYTKRPVLEPSRRPTHLPPTPTRPPPSADRLFAIYVLRRLMTTRRFPPGSDGRARGSDSSISHLI